MKYLRKIKWIKRTEKVRNEVVRQELKIEPTLKKIHGQQLKWVGRKKGMAGQGDRGKEKRTPGENIEKFNSAYFEGRKCYMERGK